MGLKGLEKLDVWRKAREFAVKAYREILPIMPQEEKWGMSQQIRRAAQSIPANIAEGYGRYYYQENIRFCYVARGSLEETVSNISLAHEMEYITEPLFNSLISESDDLVRLINGYISYLKRTKQGEKEPGSNKALREPMNIYELESHGSPEVEHPDHVSEK